MEAQGKWRERHESALASPQVGTEAAIVGIYVGIIAYAAAYERQFESKLANDYVLGPEWFEMAKAFIGLLNGPVGNRLDCGSLDAGMRNAAKEAGFVEEL